ncbi:indoleamine 2,3-dioxygenase 1-like isoform X2 [Lingula anatina]|uniref:Indoleamine 2,3-dioxygenase 1-like isoform X2 n=1 Tax=Lingula anatina TaxID=7574 RepID=A0A2R2MMS6_LINAN|nr:indoleamine 2,3-dioxygenase 1-like isoform X2 [Lingula anatina]|eukprot:XP_023931538.1 indoleamine 2,3-dioxygenase 1-like isoform X2 [Lingula anatina]
MTTAVCQTTPLEWWRHLETFNISHQVGFLLENPLDHLPGYFLPWEKLGKNAAQLMASRKLRSEVYKLPLLDFHLLNGQEEYCLAHTLLATIAHCFVWQDNDIPKILPKAVAIPWFHISQYLGLNPVYCYLDCVLAMGRKVDPNSNLEVICPAPGSPHTDWFSLVLIQVELDFAKGIQDIVDIYDSMDSEDERRLILGLKGIENTVRRMQQTTTRMYERLDPAVFYNVLRPFYEGWGAHSKLLPEGLIFEGISDTPLQFVGGSAAQSSTIQVLDAVLGVEHSEDADRYLKQIREYMPAGHREFLYTVETGPSLKTYVQQSQHDGVKTAYNQCLKALVDFRTSHLLVAVDYVLKPSQNKEERQHHSAQGTGGTNFVSFLKSTRGRTVRSVLQLDGDTPVVNKELNINT